MSIEVKQIPCLGDNYGFLVHDTETGATASIDTPEVQPINNALAEQGWTLTHILNTHHHFDHAGGNEELKAIGAARSLALPAMPNVYRVLIDVSLMARFSNWATRRSGCWKFPVILLAILPITLPKIGQPLWGIPFLP